MAEQVLSEPPCFVDVDSVFGGDEMARVYKGLIGEGVVAESHLQVTERSSGAVMGIDVAAGSAWVEGDESELLQPVYHQVVAATVQLSVDAADATNPRIDRVILRIDDATFDATGARQGVLEVLTGTPAVSPSAPAEPSNAITLAFVAVAASAASIEDADITDKRQPATTNKHRTGEVSHGLWSSAPWGAILLDGSSFDEDRYPRLFAALGSDTLPDARSRALVGSGQGSGLSNRVHLSTFGTETHTLTAAQSGLPAHAHAIDDPGHNHGSTTAAGGHTHTESSEGAHSHTESSEGGHSHDFSHDLAVFDGWYTVDAGFSANVLLLGSPTSDIRTTDPVGSHSHTIDAVGAHSHTINAVADHTHSTVSVFTGITQTLNNSSASASASHPNVQPSLALTPVVWV